METTLFTLLFLWAGWYFFILFMGLYRAYLQDRLTPVMKVLGAPAVLIGAAMDVFANIVIATFFFKDLPKEYLLTHRLRRYMLLEDGNWRKEWAIMICDNLLDPFDPSGNHC